MGVDPDESLIAEVDEEVLHSHREHVASTPREDDEDARQGDIIRDSIATAMWQNYVQINSINTLFPIRILLREANWSDHRPKFKATMRSCKLPPLYELSISTSATRSVYQVEKCIEEKISSDPDVKLAWAQHYIKKGFVALERLLKDYVGRIATGDEVYLADLFLAPQIHAAIKRFNVDMTRFPLLSRLNEAYNEIPAFQDAMLEKQPDTTLASVS
nr:glutathione s-transferase zeta class [Quercus suber]